MHGFNQGSHSVRDLALSSEPGVFLLQDHWLTPVNLSKFDDNFPSYQNTHKPPNTPKPQYLWNG